MKIDVLDRGFVRLVDTMGNDAAIVQAARVSYGAGTKTVRDDAALIRYLMRNRHTSPFEHCVIKLHIKAPIFIARQWVRHRTASWNEISARYSEVPDDDFYLPPIDRMCGQSATDRQCSGSEVIPDAAAIRNAMRVAIEDAAEAYRLALTAGLAREVARVVLPVAMYTQWYWTIDLHNLLHFLRLRMAPHAQAEMRDYAAAVAEIVKQWVPVTWAAFRPQLQDAVSPGSTQVRGSQS